MADIADVTDALYGLVVAAVCPAGLNNPGVTGSAISVGLGWPIANDIDAALEAGASMIGIYVDPGSSDPGQLIDRWNVANAPVHGLTATVSADQTTITLSGLPGAGEYVTAVLGTWRGYSFVNPGNGTAASMAAGLAAQIAADQPGTAANGAAITVVGSLVRSACPGAPGTIIQTLHRQKSIVRICVWAPNPSDRTVIARAADVALKANLRVIMPDGTQALVRYAGTIATNDNHQKLGEFRRDLMFSVQYDTTIEYPAYEVTAVGLSVTASNQ